MLEEYGFTVERRHTVEQLHYSADAYVNLVFTYSNRLTLEPVARAELRSRLKHRIGSAGVHAQNYAAAFVCTPASASCRLD